MKNSKNPIVSVVMGSESDFAVMKDAVDALSQFGVPFEVDVVSAHRTPQKMFFFAQKAIERGIKVIIAGAGGAAHLPGMIASISTLPVIGVPVESKCLKGTDSLYSIVQMPPGVPVNAMAINGAKNAGISAVQILALSDSTLAKKLVDYKKDLILKVGEMSKKVNA